MDFIRRFFADHKTLVREVVLYGLIGGLSALLDTSIFYLLDKIADPYISNFFSVNAGITTSFFLNAYFNFKVEDNLFKRGISFFAVGYIGLLLSMGVLFVGINLLKMQNLTAKIISIFIVAGVQFVLNKCITFRKKTEAK